MNTVIKTALQILAIVMGINLFTYSFISQVQHHKLTVFYQILTFCGIVLITIGLDWRYKRND